MVKYSITFNRDSKLVTVNYRLETEAGSTNRISTLSLYVNGKDIFTKNASGNTILFGSELASVANENEEVSVGFAVSDTAGWTADGSDTLRSGHPHDDTLFQN